MGQGWEEELWRNVMVEFVFCCQVVQVTCIEGTCQKETRKQSIKFESSTFCGCLHTGMITHYVQKSLLVLKFVSIGGQNYTNKKGHEKKKISMLSYSFYTLCLQQLMAQDSPSQS